MIHGSPPLIDIVALYDPAAALTVSSAMPRAVLPPPMTKETAPEVKGTCFVVMGFGKKTDFETGRTLDLDKTYKGIIKDAVTDAGLKCRRD